jgi:type II secretory pathway pseudopilin PulG
MTNRKGQTLIEVVVAAMVAAMTSTAVFSVVVSSHVSDTKSDKREAAASAINALQNHLKIFVSADYGDVRWSPNPCFPGSCPGTWPGLLPAGQWPLSPGVHNASFLLANMPQLIVSGLPSPTLTYLVQDQSCGFGAASAVSCKLVTFTLTYPD